MRSMPRLPLLAGVLLFAGAPLVFAQSSLPDPIAPAVIGRSLWEWALPAREKAAKAPHAKDKSAAAKPARHKQRDARASGSTKVARHPAATGGSAQSRTATLGAGAATTHVAKQALDDRVDPRMRVDDVGKGTHFASKPLAPGVYFGNAHRAAVQKYFEAHPLASGTPAGWRIGEPVPHGVPLAPVPGSLLAALPKVPPGHRYVELGGDVLLVAGGSNMVVDGISHTAR